MSGLLHRSRSSWTVCVLALSLVACSVPALADYEPNPAAPRAEVPQDYQWNPYHIFPDNAAWDAEFAAVEKEIPKLAAYAGRLAESPDVLYQCAENIYAVLDRLNRLYMYAQALYDVDQGVSENRARQGRIGMLWPTFGENIAFVEPEILQIDQAVLDRFLREHEGLQTYAYYLQDLLRLKDHTLSQPEERLLALTGNVRGVPSEAHEALLGVDIEFPDIVDENGETVPLTVSGFTKYRASDVYSVRKQAAEAFFGTLRAYENTFATLLDGAVKSHIMEKEARGYDSCLQASLAPDNISTDAYRMLIETINANLPRTLHKYIALRKKVFGLEGPVTFANLYNPLLEGVEPEYTYDEAQKLILAGLQPMGKEYLGYLETGMNPASGWIDVYPNADKRSGAYSSGGLARDLHPFVLHNYNNTLDAVFTTAHEFGHALHSVYSKRAQPPVYGSYTTFLAEIASTCNEALLTNYMLEKAKNDTDMQLLLLNQRLESIRLTIFRQTLFAEFELLFHEYAEEGNPLTAEYLNGLYKELIQKYYGPEFEMAANDECEWMFIPHFYYNFYVFSYATGLTSGLSLAKQIDDQGQKVAERYVNNMLKAGSSAPPLDILRSAGVDLETPAPIEDMLDMFAETIAAFDRTWEKAYGK